MTTDPLITVAYTPEGLIRLSQATQQAEFLDIGLPIVTHALQQAFFEGHEASITLKVLTRPVAITISYNKDTELITFNGNIIFCADYLPAVTDALRTAYREGRTQLGEST